MICYYTYTLGHVNSISEIFSLDYNLVRGHMKTISSLKMVYKIFYFVITFRIDFRHRLNGVTPGVTTSAVEGRVCRNVDGIFVSTISRKPGVMYK